MSDRGVYVVAFGDPARKCAVRCVESWHYFMPGVPVSVAGVEKLGPEDVFVKAEDEDVGGRSVKTKIWDLAPAEWEYVLYADADTELIAPVPSLFGFLEDGWDALFCLNAQRYVTAENMRRPDNGDECDETVALYGTNQLIQFNGGIFGFRRNERTQALVQAWHSEWDAYGKRDQQALMRALFHYPVRLLALGVEFNTSLRYYSAARSVGVVHSQMNARRWKGIIKGRSDSDEAWAATHPSWADLGGKPK